MEHNKTHEIVVVSVPVLSHQLQIAELCKRFLQLQPNLHITFILPIISSLPKPSKTVLDALSSLNIDSIVLPPVNLPQPTPPPAMLFPLAMSHSLPSIQDALTSLTTSSSSKKVVALVADYFAYEILPFSKKLNILSYIFLPTAASLLQLCFKSSKLHETITCEFKDLKEPIKLPGCVPIHGRDLPNALQDRSSQVYTHFLLRCKGLLLADGILVNSFKELEPDLMKAMAEEGANNNGSSECLAWLDSQKDGSVLYVSFGSGGTISEKQIRELAMGLEMSSQKFLWVLREPNEIPSANYFKDSSCNDPRSFLPCGFLERTKGQGLVVPHWAPQVEVLAHRATGGFLTHCGWFSTVESIVQGVPIIAWPLFSEQRTIAVILGDGMRVAIRAKVDEESGVVGKDEIADAVKSLMVGNEGMEIRERMRVLKDEAAAAIKEDGSSTVTLFQLLAKWTT
ncbi:hypothetical protein PIB30_036983 [Stylosanthes scabra]|uniref:Glycosyltransferase n=1 Tax=Stylosanthes scabra TaxID=79078 RepID=A0ABU6YG10_9FABA|nr:hypothetical protein [Stylosanthes scabra]